jgi:hypothetical protein
MGGGGHDLGVRHGRRVHGDARVMRAGDLGGTGPIGGTHGLARAGE